MFSFCIQIHSAPSQPCTLWPRKLTSIDCIHWTPCSLASREVQPMEAQAENWKAQGKSDWSTYSPRSLLARPYIWQWLCVMSTIPMFSPFTGPSFPQPPLPLEVVYPPTLASPGYASPSIASFPSPCPHLWKQFLCLVSFNHDFGVCHCPPGHWPTGEHFNIFILRYYWKYITSTPNSDIKFSLHINAF